MEYRAVAFSSKTSFQQETFDLPNSRHRDSRVFNISARKFNTKVIKISTTAYVKVTPK